LLNRLVSGDDFPLAEGETVALGLVGGNASRVWFPGIHARTEGVWFWGNGCPVFPGTAAAVEEYVKMLSGLPQPVLRRILQAGW